MATPLLANARVLGYLGRALSHELSAVQQYLTHAGLARLWGLDEVAAHFRREAQEEQKHAERLTNRMLALGAMPNASRITPVRAGRSLIELLRADWALEARAVELYHEAARHCARIEAIEDWRLFRELYDEELHHAREIEDWLARLRTAARQPDITDRREP